MVSNTHGKPLDIPCFGYVGYCNILDHFLCHCGFDHSEPLVPTLQHLVTPSLAKAFEQFAGTTGRPVDLSLRAKAEFECDLYVKAPKKDGKCPVRIRFSVYMNVYCT
jgi:hypothetical protein